MPNATANSATTSPGTNGVSGPARAARVLAVHARRGELRLLTVRAGKAGEPALIVEDARTVSAASLVGKGARDVPVRPGTDAIVAVLPAARCVARTVDAKLPDSETATAEELAQALALVAEVSAPAAPAHRRAAGVVGGGVGASAGSAVAVTSWQGAPEAALAALDAARGIDAWVPEFAALWWLARVGGGASAEAAGQPSLSADRDSGGVCAVAAGAERLGVRQLIEDAGDAEAWTDALTQTVSGAARQAGLSATAGLGAELARELAAEQAPLLVAGRRTLGRPIPGAGDERWLADYGLCLGAAAAALMADAGERPLMGTAVNPPGTGQRWVAAAIAWLAHPVRAAAAVVLCLAVLLATPWAVASARLARLERQQSEAGKANEGLEKAAVEADYAALLREKRWPMTKLLAELVGTAPKEVQLDSVTIDTAAARAGTPIRVMGTTTSAEAVIAWRTAMSKGPVFESVQTPRTGEGQSTFELQARVAQPLLAMASDPATLARIQRDAEANSRSTTADALKGAGTTGTRPGTATRSTGRSGGGGAPSGPTDAGTPLPRPDAATARPLPAPLSDAQIAALDMNGVRAEFAQRAPAARRPNISPEDKSRLETEVAKLRERLTSGAAK